jgi:hypothetical protein
MEQGAETMTETEQYAKQVMESSNIIVLRNGVPDFVCITEDGDLCFVEVKNSYDCVRPDQKRFARVLRAAKLRSVSTCVLRVGGELAIEDFETRGPVPLKIPKRLKALVSRKQMHEENEARQLNMKAAVRALVWS